MARPVWTPTDAQRRQAETMAAYGIPEADIARVLGVSKPTLRKHCGTELDTGATRANSKVADFLFYGICGGTGKPAFKDERARVTAAIFWMKTRGGWSETSTTNTPVRRTVIRSRSKLSLSENVSPAELLASLPPEQLAAFLKRTSDRELEAIEHDWGWWGRPNQQAPKGDWRTWLLLAGRGFGKTRSGAECIRDQVIHHGRRRIALVAPTAADARDVMVEGESGLLAIGPPQQRPQYEPTKRRLTWPNGAIATLFSADEPERLRGPQHDAAWCDELASWRYPEAWDMLMLGLRLGTDPRVVVTTTPRPTKLIRELIADPTVVVTRGTTHENRANLAPVFLGQIVRKYQGTRLGRQELEAEILEDVPGALWNRGVIEATRASRAPSLIRVVVAIDPAASSTAGAD